MTGLSHSGMPQKDSETFPGFHMISKGISLGEKNIKLNPM
jgi:hypothetical protein